MYKAKFLSNINLIFVALIAGVLGVGFFAAPNISRAEGVCSPIYQTPIFNPYPQTNSGADCTEFSFMRARVFRNGQVVGNYAPGDISTQPGDEVDVVLYIHNGAVENGNPSLTTMRGVQLTTNANMSAAFSHSVTAQVTAANSANSLYGSMQISTPGNTTLEVAPGSELWTARETGYSFKNFSGVVNSTRPMPDQQACFEFIRFVYFSFKVVAAAPPVVKNPSGAISGEVGGLISGQCLKTGAVTWSTQNVDSNEITVQSPGEAQGEHFFVTNILNGSNATPWLQSGHTYIFILYNTGSGQRAELARFVENVPDFSCGAPPVYTPPVYGVATSTPYIPPTYTSSNPPYTPPIYTSSNPPYTPPIYTSSNPPYTPPTYSATSTPYTPPTYTATSTIYQPLIYIPVSYGFQPPIYGFINPPFYQPPVYGAVFPAAAGASVLGGNVNLTYSKRALNETKNANATQVNASREDFITYTLTVANNGNAPVSNFVITDDLSQVLQYADVADNGGGSLIGSVISYPAITVPAGGSVSKSFRVRVKFSLAGNSSYAMTNTYGNTLTIRINPVVQVLGAFVAPKTGADTFGFVFAGILTLAAVVFKKEKV